MKTTKLLALGLATIVAVASTSAMASSDDGEKLFKKKCQSCHSVKPGEHKIGPSLAGVVGKKAGSTDFSKYKALQGADLVWDDKNLDGWLENPKKFIGKNTAMTAKIKKAEDRAAIIEYLKQN